VGSFAIQLAKLYGAEVTGVDHTNKLAMMVSLGADHVIDYTKEDCTTHKKQYDLILDVIGYHSLFDYRRILAPAGNYRMIGGPIGLILQSSFVAPVISLFSKKKMGVLAHQPNKGLDTLIEYVETGKIKPVIDRVFPFEETREALNYFGSGSVMGKVVIKVS
jgi:NADPH:quinone reductase-like Zn-dependent oxidoreductase